MIEELITVGSTYELGGTVDGERGFLAFALCPYCRAVHFQLNIGQLGSCAFTIGDPNEAREVAADLLRAADECAKIRGRN
jgi:hypothetical protein